jgi:ABC-type Fe3+/spermidine/putrescine transport system ATPase subunit
MKSEAPSTPSAAGVALERVSAGYGAARVLDGLSLEVEAGELLALLGPSGCGKTTALRVIAGLLKPAGGVVKFGGEVMNKVPAERRGAAMVFQKPLLFPYLTVAENVAFGLKMRKVRAGEIGERVAESLRLVQLDGYERRKPQELSGGQEQRVALARALVTRPRVLLLDEPFSALDESLRGEMRALVRDLQRRLKITTVFVTHDQAEAASLADRVALLLDGRLEQLGAPRDFYTAPRTPRAARFFGWAVVEGERQGGELATPAGRFTLPASPPSAQGGGRLALAFRPEAVRAVKPRDGAAPPPINELAARVEAVLDLGPRLRVTVSLLSGERLELELEPTPGAHIPQAGAPVTLPVNPAHVVFLDSPPAACGG